MTTLPVTIAHLAGRTDVSGARLERAVATIVGRAPTVRPALDAVVEELAARGRRGIPLLRDILARQDRSGIRKTGLERRFEHVLAGAGEAPMVPQLDLGGHAWIGRVDYVDRALLLLVEVDSVTHHSSRADQLRDAARDAALLAAGYRKVIRIPEEWLWHEPWRVVEAIRAARRELRMLAA